MIERAIVPLIFAFFCAQTRISFDAQASAIPADAVATVFKLNTSRVNISENGGLNGTKRGNKQLDEIDDIDVDGPYGYIPRVVHGVGKIVKGLLNGSVHGVMHGAFGIAPDDVADDLIGTYNQIFGIPDPDDLPDSVRKPKPKATKAPVIKKTSSNSTTQKSAEAGKKKKAKDEDDDDENDDLDEEEDDL